MRTLYLLRHAKSSWDDPTIRDHDRPLAARGARAARSIATHLSSAHIRPALVLCSSARRTVQTLEALREALGDAAEVRIEPALYGADSEDILGRLRAVDPSVTEVLVIGHNPGLQDLAVELSDEGDPALLDRLRTKFPTGALVTFDFHVTWRDLGRGHTHLAGFVTPKQLA